jgi:hypothetical protein
LSQAAYDRPIQQLTVCVVVLNAVLLASVARTMVDGPQLAGVLGKDSRLVDDDVRRDHCEKGLEVAALTEPDAQAAVAWATFAVPWMTTIAGSPRSAEMSSLSVVASSATRL